MAVGFVPVDIAEFCVNLHVHRAAHLAAVGNAGGLDAFQDGIELSLADAKTKMSPEKSSSVSMKSSVSPSLT